MINYLCQNGSQQQQQQQPVEQLVPAAEMGYPKWRVAARRGRGLHTQRRYSHRLIPGSSHPTRIIHKNAANCVAPFGVFFAPFFRGGVTKSCRAAGEQGERWGRERYQLRLTTWIACIFDELLSESFHMHNP